MRSTLVMGLVLLAACGPKEDDANNSNNTNTNNTTNNVIEDMGTTDMADAGSDGLPDAPIAVTARVNGSSPYTIPALTGQTIGFEVVMEGQVDDSPTGLNYKIPVTDTCAISGVVELALSGPTTTVEVEIPPLKTACPEGPEFLTGPFTVEFTPTEPARLIMEGKAPSFVFHQTAEQVNSNWDQIMAFEPAPPSSNAILVSTEVVDTNRDGKLDLVTLWRADERLHLQTYFGPDLSAGLVNDIVVGIPAGDSIERSDIHRRKRPGGSHPFVYWAGGDPITKTLRIVVAEIDGGVLGNTTTYETTDGSIPTPSEFLGIEFLDAPNLAVDAPPEIMVLYRGVVAGKKAFAAVKTDSENGKLVTIKSFDTLAGVTPVQDVKVGLTRGFSASSDLRDAVSESDLYAWTFGKTGPSGEHEVRLALLAGGEAGITQRTATVTGVTSREAEFELQSIDLNNDGVNDLILSSFDQDTQELAVRNWLVSLPTTLGAQGSLKTGGTVLTKPREKDNDPGQLCGNTCHFRTAPPRFYSSSSYPFLKTLAAKSGNTDTSFVATMVESRLGVGEPSSVEIAWGKVGSSTTNPAYVAPITLGGSVFAATTPVEAIASGYAAGGLNIAERDLDSKVLVASHPSGVLAHFGVSSLQLATRSTAASIHVSGPGFAPAEVNISGRGQIVGLLKDAESATHYLVTRSRDESAWNFNIWRVSVMGIEGPGIFSVPQTAGIFEPTTSTSKNFVFASSTAGAEKVGEAQYFTLTPAQMSNAAKAKSSTKLGAPDLLSFGGTMHVTSGRKIRKQVAGNRHREERDTKTVAVHQFNVGTAATASLEEMMTVAGNDETDGCPFQTQFFAGDFTTSTPVVLAESAMDGCWDLPMPIMSGDFCGVGGDQIITVAVTDTSSRTSWPWQVLLWMRMGDQIMATELGTFELGAQQEAEFTATDINGDGLVDLIVTPNETPLGFGQQTIILSDGLGGNLGPVTIPSLTNTIHSVPGAGSGLPAGGIGCGNGLACGNSQGTKNATSKASTKPQLL